MGNKGKASHPVVKTHKRYFKKQKTCDLSDALLWENVTEWELKMLKRSLGKGWKFIAVKLDPQLFGFPCARARLYVLAWKTSKLKWHMDVPALVELIRGLCVQCHVGFSCSSYWWQTGVARVPLSKFEAWITMSLFVYLKKTRIQKWHFFELMSFTLGVLALRQATCNSTTISSRTR